MMRILFAIFLALILALAPADGDRTVTTADELRAALLAGAMPAGSTLTIAPGQYDGLFTSYAASIRVVSQPGALINGGIEIRGADTTWDDLAVAYLDWQTRAFTSAAQLPATAQGIVVYGPRTTVHNCRVHDTQNGIMAWESAPDTTIDGCVTWDTGYFLSDGGGHGHGLYVQNATGQKIVKNSAFLQTASNYSIHAFGQAGRLNNLRFQHNAVTWYWLVGGGQPVRNLTVIGNMTRPGPVADFGYGNMSNQDAIVRDNKFGALTLFSGFQTLTVTGNLWNNGAAVRLRRPAGATISWDANAYACSDWACNGQFQLDGVNMPFGTWRTQTGFDAASMWMTYLRGLDFVDIGPGPGLGMVTIANARNKASVPIDTGWLPPGSYRLVNAANPAESLAFQAGAPLSVPMTSGWTIATPIGAAAPLATWDRTFGVFYVEAL